VAIFSASGFFVHTPCGPRKSGMPESVEMPAPVRTTMRRAWSMKRRAAARSWSSGATPTRYHKGRSCDQRAAATSDWTRPATARTRRGAASQMAAIESAQAPIASSHAVAEQSLRGHHQVEQAGRRVRGQQQQRRVADREAEAAQRPGPLAPHAVGEPAERDLADDAREPDHAERERGPLAVEADVQE